MPLLPRAWFSNLITSGFLNGLTLVVMAISGRWASGFEVGKGFFGNLDPGLHGSQLC